MKIGTLSSPPKGKQLLSDELAHSCSEEHTGLVRSAVLAHAAHTPAPSLALSRLPGLPRSGAYLLVFITVGVLPSSAPPRSSCLFEQWLI